MTDAYRFILGLTNPRLATFRNCVEAGMDYETCLGCSGLRDQPALHAYFSYSENN